MTRQEGPALEVDPRDVLAAERTLLAWLRGGLALMGLGFVIARSAMFLGGLEAATAAEPKPTPVASAVGFAVVGMGVILNVWASLRHRHTSRQLRSGATDIGWRGVRAIGIGAVLGGLLLLVLLLALA